jgi:hypothetical protein
VVEEVRDRLQDVFELLLAGGDGEGAVTKAQVANLCIEDLKRENVAGDNAELGRPVRGHGNVPALGARDVLHARSGVEHRTAVWGVIGDAYAQVSKRLSSLHLHRNRATTRERRDILELVAEGRDAGRIFYLVHYDVEQRRVVGDVYVCPEHRKLALERHVAPDVACAVDDIFARRGGAERDVMGGLAGMMDACIEELSLLVVVIALAVWVLHASIRRWSDSDSVLRWELTWRVSEG